MKCKTFQRGIFKVYSLYCKCSLADIFYIVVRNVTVKEIKYVLNFKRSET